MNKTEKALVDMGITDIPAAIELDKKITNNRRISPYVCLCGHPVSRHSRLEDGDYVCKPSRMYCHCTKVYEILEAEDTRPFLRKSNSYGAEHALARGLIATLAAGKNCSWVTVNSQCFDCGIEKLPLIPAVVENGIPEYPTGKILFNLKNQVVNSAEYSRRIADLLLCQTCLDTRVQGQTK